MLTEKMFTIDPKQKPEVDDDFILNFQLKMKNEDVEALFGQLPLHTSGKWETVVFASVFGEDFSLTENKLLITQQETYFGFSRSYLGKYSMNEREANIVSQAICECMETRIKERRKQLEEQLCNNTKDVA